MAFTEDGAPLPNSSAAEENYPKNGVCQTHKNQAPRKSSRCAGFDGVPLCKSTSTANSFPESLPECSVCAHRARRCWQARKPGALSWFSARRFTLLRTIRGNRQRKIHQTMRRLAVHDPSLTGALGGRRRCAFEQINDAKCIRKILRYMFRLLPLRVKALAPHNRAFARTALEAITR